MTAEEPNRTTASPVTRWVRRLRIASIVVLLAGAAIAGAVYAFGNGPVNRMTRRPLPRTRLTPARWAGCMATWACWKDWANDLKEPGTQALLVVVITVVVAGGGFGSARFLARKRSP